MKFDFCIGNPPYQEEATGTKLSDEPVYHLFFDEAFKIADKVEMVTPGRFLFNGGKTPKEWNKMILSNKHFKVLDYQSDSRVYFGNVAFAGGVAISYLDKEKIYGSIGTFFSFKEVGSVLSKVKSLADIYLDTIVYSIYEYRFSEILFIEHPEVKFRLSKGIEYAIASNTFDKFLNVIFFLTKPLDGNSYIQIYGRLNGKRTYLWINEKYILKGANFNYWKLFISGANGGAGVIGDKPAMIIGLPIVAEPGVGHNQTFLSIGCFKSKFEVEACLKYLKTKFCRLLIGTLKVTQNAKKRVYANVPLQDFTVNSDIDWLKSVHDIDLQLYRKYGLDEKEIAFIEEKVKVME